MVVYYEEKEEDSRVHCSTYIGQFKVNWLKSKIKWAAPHYVLCISTRWWRFPGLWNCVNLASNALKRQSGNGLGGKKRKIGLYQANTRKIQGKYKEHTRLFEFRSLQRNLRITSVWIFNQNLKQNTLVHSPLSISVGSE